MFKHAEFQSVEAFLADPAYAGLSLHARIQRAIRQLILDGALKHGYPLPASRVFAKSLRVSRDTVEAAYAQLHADGFIERRIGSGSFVAEVNTASAGRGLVRRDTASDDLPPSLSRRSAAISRGDGFVEQLGSPRPFTSGPPDTRMFPMPIWERLQRQVVKDHGAGALQYGDPQGVEPLRRVIADYVNLELGAQASADRVLVLTSAQQALTLCATVLLDPGDPIYVEWPGYYSGASRAFDAADLACIPVGVDGHGIAIDELRRDPNRARVAYVMPSRHFPEATATSERWRLALFEWAVKHNGWIIEDGHDVEFRFEGPPAACIQGLDPHRRTIYVGSFSNSIFPGLRIGYVVLPPQLVRPFTVARTVLSQGAAPLSQLTLARFIEAGYFGTHSRIMKALYTERRSVLVRAIRRELLDFVVPLTGLPGLQIPCFLTGGLAEHATIDAARKVGVGLTGMSELTGFRAESKPGWLMGFAAYTPAEIEAGVGKLAAAMRPLRHPNGTAPSRP